MVRLGFLQLKLAFLFVPPAFLHQPVNGVLLRHFLHPPQLCSMLPLHSFHLRAQLSCFVGLGGGGGAGAWWGWEEWLEGRQAFQPGYLLGHIARVDGGLGGMVRLLASHCSEGCQVGLRLQGGWGLFLQRGL